MQSSEDPIIVNTAETQAATHIEPEYTVALDSDRTTYAPGEEIWVTVQLQSKPPITPRRKFKVGGTVVLVGEEKVTVVDGISGSVSIFKPIVVFLDDSTQIQRWRVKLHLPDDVPPSCELAVFPPCGAVVYIITARLQISQGPLITAGRRIRVVSSSILAEARAADVPGVIVLQPTIWNTYCSCLLRFQGRNVEEVAPELRVTLYNSQSSFRPGEHIKYRVMLRGNGANGSATSLPRIDALEVSIYRARWFSDNRGRDTSTTEIVKPPQRVDFSGSAAGNLPVDFQGSVCVPLGIPPTVRGILLSNDYDLVVNVSFANRECGSIQVPITVFRDVEGNYLSPPLLPVNKWNADAGSSGREERDMHGAMPVGFSEDEEMEELALT